MTNLTNDQIDRMLAEKLMEWTIEPGKAEGRNYPEDFYNLKEHGFQHTISDWHPTSDITQALGDGGQGTVVGKMAALNYDFQLRTIVSSGKLLTWTSAFSLLDGYKKWVDADTPAEAICQAAVKALKAVNEIGQVRA